MRALFIALTLSSCATPLSLDVENAVRASIERVRAAYPELDGERISIDTFREDGVFFASNFSPWSVLGELDYVIHANPDAFAHGLGGDALDGVIAHELAHTLDYEQRSLVEIGVHLLRDEQSFERRTDLIAIDRGYGPQLLSYRVWQFRVLRKEQVAEKKRIYYGPLEISLLLEARERCPSRFRDLIESPPPSSRELMRRLNATDLGPRDRRCRS